MGLIIYFYQVKIDKPLPRVIFIILLVLLFQNLLSFLCCCFIFVVVLSIYLMFFFLSFYIKKNVARSNKRTDWAIGQRNNAWVYKTSIDANNKNLISYVRPNESLSCYTRLKYSISTPRWCSSLFFMWQ